jgi:hypothetical protein
MASGLEYTFELGTIPSQSTNDLEYSIFSEGPILTNDGSGLSPLDPQSYPDYSALRDVFDIPESWGAF